MGATAFLIPNWRFIIFLTGVYLLVGAYKVTTPTTMPFNTFSLILFGAAFIVAIGAAALAGVIGGKWAGGAAFVISLFAAAWALGVMNVLDLLSSTVLFSGLGLPIIIQIGLAIPCTLILIWQGMAFFSAIFGQGASVSGD